MRARKRPLGDRRIWENGPRDRRFLSALLTSVALEVLNLWKKAYLIYTIQGVKGDYRRSC